MMVNYPDILSLDKEGFLFFLTDKYIMVKVQCTYLSWFVTLFLAHK